MDQVTTPSASSHITPGLASGEDKLHRYSEEHEGGAAVESPRLPPLDSPPHPNQDDQATRRNWALGGHNINIRLQEIRVQLTFVGKDPDSNPTGSPTIYRTDRGSWVVQGWAVTDPDALAQMNVPEGEACVEIPDRMLQFFAIGK
jgi:hypothetical protein